MTKEQRFALVTGCGAGGIGEALCKELVSQGVHAIATVLPWEEKEHLASTGISCFELDVTIEDSIRALKEKVVNLTNGRLDVLVNNAGICYTMTAIDTDVSAVQKMFDVNVFGPMRMVHHFHDMLIESCGTIVNIGSVGGVVPYVYGSSYNASKAALVHYGNTLRLEMAPLGVKVVNIISGEIGTNILKSDVNRELPKGSYYFPLATEFKSHVQRTPKTTSRSVYAKSVVAQILGSRPPAWYWTGENAATVRFLDTFGFRTIWDYIFWPTFSLTKLQKAVKRS